MQNKEEGNIKKRNITIAVIFYIVILLSLSISGFLGDNDKENVEYALKYFNQTDIDTGKSYFVYRLASSVIYRVLIIILALIYVLKGYHNRFIETLSSKIKPGILLIFISFATIFILINIIRIPFSVYSSFYLGKIYGVMKADFGTWFLRYMAGSGISIFLFCASLSVVSYLIDRTRRFYIYIPIAILFIGITISIIYPRIITPLFYEMKKPANNDLKKKITSMLENSKIEIDDIYIIDSGRISSSVNAYMTGFGKERRIVLYDTLLENYSHDEILSVIAHETCHYVEEHMLIGITLGVAGIMLVLFLLNKFLYLVINGDLKNLIKPQMHGVFIITMILMSFIGRPIENAISRQMESRADLYSLKLAGKPETFINMKKKMAIDNRTNILPGWIFSRFYYSHPPILSRIKTAGDYLGKK